MEKTYNIAVPNTIKRLSQILYLFGLWTKQKRITFLQLIYILLFTFVVLLVFLGACSSENKDRAVFLGVVWLVCIVQIYRMYFTIWKQHMILSFIERTSVNQTNDYDVYTAADKKLDVILTVARTFIVTSLLTTVAGIFVPFLYSEKTLILPIAFPVDYRTSQIAFWFAHACGILCLFSSVICCIPMTIIWYIMLNTVIKLEVLGNDFKNLGKIEPDDSRLYLQQLIQNIETMEVIDGIIKDFTSIFSNLFLLQTVTSSISICGSTYILAFSSHDDFFQDQIYCVLLFYCLFDVYMMMYFGNEIELYSDRLSYCMFQSDWTSKSQPCKKAFLITVERLKRPQKMLISKLIPLNLVTFRAIVNRAYSLFNILQNFRV